jgi:hypothetical protein
MARYGFAFFDSGVRFDAPDVIPPTNMRNLSRTLENPFDDPNIGLNKLLAFTTDHRQRMLANNDSGELTARITATTSALDLLQEMAGGDQTQLGQRKARKQSKNAFREALPAKVGKVIAAVEARYGEDAPEVLECIPQGRTVFSKCPDDVLEAHLQVLVNGVTAHVAELGAPLVAEATALLTGWGAVFDQSEESTGEKTATEADKRAARENLQLMLFLNLLKLAEMFPRQPEKLALYMQQSLLETHPAQPDEPPAPPTGP